MPSVLVAKYGATLLAPADVLLQGEVELVAAGKCAKLFVDRHSLSRELLIKLAC